MTKWLKRPSKTLEAVHRLTDEQAAVALAELHAALKDTILSQNEQAVKVDEIEARILEQGGGDG